MGLLTRDGKCENCGTEVPRLTLRQAYNARLVYCRKCFYVAKNALSILKGGASSEHALVQLVSDINQDTMIAIGELIALNEKQVKAVQYEMANRRGVTDASDV